MPSPRNSDVTSCEQHCEIRYEFRITKVPDVVLSVVRITRRILTVSTEARRDATPVPALPRTQHYHAPRMSWRAPASRVCGVAGALYAKVSKRHFCRSSLHLHAMCRRRPVGESVRALTAFAEWAMRTSCTDVLPATPASCLTCLAFIDTRVALCSPKCIFAWRRGFQRLEVCSHGQVHTRPH